ncbi:MAG TPA: hypothetical protein VIK41_14030 [Gemmatimonadaceae bacterium]
MNRPAFFSVATRGVQSTTALITIVFVGRFLTLESQGYYYAILSFVAFVMLGEFGLNYAVMQSASHEAAALTGDRAAPMYERVITRLRALLFGAMRFTAYTTSLAVVLVAAIGTRTFVGSRTPGLPSAAWAGPWVLAILGVAASQQLAPRFALLEGTGGAAAVWRFRMQQELAIAATLWTALALGFGLWSLGIAYTTRFIYSTIWLRSHSAAELLRALVHGDASASPPSNYWRTEVWPFQWRIGLSVVSGYFIFQLLTPIVFALDGAHAAGQFGMTMAITNGLLTATTAWLNSQAPLYGRLIAQRDYGELNREFTRAVGSSFVVVVAAAVAVISVVTVLAARRHPISMRLLPPLPFALLMASTVINHLIFALAVYLRAHRREPLLIPSVAGALLTALTIYLTARSGNLVWVTGSYLALTALGGLVTLIIFISRSRSWHALDPLMTTTDAA